MLDSWAHDMLNYSNAGCTYDVAVIGAGPAGTIAARDLARSGARVAIVDGSHPREKTCGGGGTARAIELANKPAALLDGCAIQSAAFEADEIRAHVAIPSNALTVFPRAAFDPARPSPP